MSKTEDRFKDAELLTESVLVIMNDIKLIEDRYSQEIAPFRQAIKELEEAFLDKYLVDSSGIPVRPGMILEKEGKHFRVLSRYQQFFVKYFGNARVRVMPIGKKRPIEIWHEDLPEYTIVD